MPSVSELIAMGYGGYAGWGDTEANANFNATGGSGKYTAGSSGGSSGGGTIDYSQYIAPAKQMVNPYYDQLIKDAQGDWNLAQKYIKEDYAYYLGKGDARMAQFIASVASETESRQGVLEFDYQQAIKRNKEDYLTATGRLSEAETAYKTEEQFNAEKAGKERASDYYTRQVGSGVINQDVNKPSEDEAEKERQFRLSAYNREMAQKKEDLLKENTRSIEDITSDTRRKIYEQSLKNSPTGRAMETGQIEYNKEAVGPYSDIEKQRQEAKQAYVNWLGSTGIKNVSALTG